MQARLDAEGVKKSPEADRRTLLRRVTLDLTGLAPTAAETDAFLADRSPDAYEKVVSRLMASPRYAEKQAIEWLDAVRYADTAGFHGDNPYPVWPYRDWVLKAIRDNKPFDAFTREQLAGDLLPGATVDQRIASAYNRLNRVSGEGGLQEKEYLAKYGADRVRTVSTVWMGSTLGCAECHDHKFDPFKAKDFYAMKAFFADINEPGMARDGNGRNGPEAWGVKLAMPTPDEKRRLEDLDSRIAEARKALADRTAALGSSASSGRAPRSIALTGRVEVAVPAPGVDVGAGRDDDAFTTISACASAACCGSRKSRSRTSSWWAAPTPTPRPYTITLKPGAGTWRSLGIEVARDDTLPGAFVARGGIGAELSEIEADVDGRRLSFAIAASAGAFGNVEMSPANAIDGDLKTAWSFGDFGTSSSNPFAAFQLAQPLTTSANTTIVIRIRQVSPVRRATLGRFRLALSAGPAWGDDAIAGGTVEDNAVDEAQEYRGLPARLVQALSAAPGATAGPAAPSEGTGGGGRGRGAAPDAQTVAQAYFQLSSPDLAPLAGAQARLEAAKAALEMRVTRVMVSEAMPAPRETRILPRGNWMDDSGAVVEPAIPGFMGELNTGGRRATRLDLANWLVSAQNPLTARAYVNRIWHQFFGTGLSNTLADLGSQGEWPSHLALLDWLAAEFMAPQYDADRHACVGHEARRADDRDERHLQAVVGSTA